MKTKARRQKEIQTQDKVFISAKVLEMYIDLAVRGLVAFFIFGVCGYLLLIQVFHLPIYYAMPIIFLSSIISSPLLSKIKLGHKVQDKYDNFLRKVIYYIKQHEKRN